MALITEQDVARTIINLMHAGKRFPQQDALFGLSGEERKKEAQNQLQQTVKLWFKTFGGSAKDISINKWKKAEEIALTMSGNIGVDLNLITPALMQTALNRCDSIALANSVKQAEEDKAKEQNIIDVEAIQTWEQRNNVKLLAWTLKKLAFKSLIGPYHPSDEEIHNFGKEKAQLSDEDIKKNWRLIKVYLNNCKFCKTACQGKRNCYMRGHFEEVYLDENKELCFRPRQAICPNYK